MIHTPVLKKEILKYLNPKANENFIDGTIGEAGHTILILEKNKPDGKVLGIDQDSQQIENAKLETLEFKNRIILANDSYANVKEIIEKTNFKPVDGILLDLGYSSWQLEKSKKGFSFMKDEGLDMRYNLKNNLTAQKIINEYPENRIIKILWDYGEEKFAKQITKKIIEQRKIADIKNTFKLREIIESAIPKKFQHRRIHCATKSFQALRIAVNDELNNLVKFLPVAISILSSGGRLVVISFHSLEDRIVKNFFREKEKKRIVKILTPKPIIAAREEILINPKSRSAKLRAVIKLQKHTR